MIRMSSYEIISDKLKGGGYAILNGLSGAIDLVSEDFIILVNHKRINHNNKELYFNKKELPKDVLNSFLERGHMLTCSHQEELERLDILSKALQEERPNDPNIVIVPDMDCNYRCTYCYERCMQNQLHGFNKKELTNEDIDTIYEIIAQLDTTNKTNSKKRQITLYGGEPLNAKNFPQVDYMIRKGTELGYSFMAITNGHDLDCYLSLLGSGKIERIQVSIDGPKEIHDKRRIVKDGTSSFDKIWNNLNLVVANTDAQITIRSQIDSSNVTSYLILLDLFKQEGWLDHFRLTINPTLVVNKEETSKLHDRNTINELKTILKPNCEKYHNIFIGCEEMNYEQDIFHSLLQDSHFKFKISHCGATTGMYIFQPDGMIHACFETLGLEYGTIGSYYKEKNHTKLNIKDTIWFHRLATSIPECRECPYCLICAGGCPNLAKTNLGDINKPYCNGFQKMYPTILAQAVERYLNLYNL